MKKVLLIGLGHIGKKHLSSLGLIGIKPTIVEKNISNYYSKNFLCENNLKDIKNIRDYDFGIICLPNDLHYSYGKKLLNLGLNLIIEKPMCLKTYQALDLMNIAISKNKKIFVVKQNRFGDQIIKLKELINTIKWGRPIGFSMDIIWNRNEEYFLKSDWRGSKKKDGGILYTQFSHYLDLIEWLFGKIDYSYGSIENHLHKKVSDTEDSICLLLGRKNEFSGVAHFSINAYQKNLGNRFTIIFEKGHIILEGQNFDKIVSENGKTSFPKIKPNLKKLFDKKNTTNLHDRFYVYLDRFLKSNSKDKLNLLATGDDGLENLFFIESLYKKIK